MGEFFFGSPGLWFLSLVIPARPTPITPYGPGDTVYYGSWAGDRIICLGADSGQFPDNILTDSDIERLNAFRQTKESFNELNLVDLFRESSTLKRSTTVPAEDPYGSLDIWVLRNLSKREYVRSNGIPYLCDDGKLVYLQCVGLNGTPGLDQVLLSRIGWSANNSINMAYEGPLQLHQGPWAGDRFDVQVFDDVVESMRDEGKWLDVTRIAAKDMFDLIKSDCGYKGDFIQEPEECDEE